MTAVKTPRNWREAPLSELCERTELTNPQKEPGTPFFYVDVSSVSNETFRIVEPKGMLGKDAPSRARKLIRENDIIFATVRPSLKRIAVIPPALDGQVCSTGFCVLRSKQDALDPTFLYFCLLTEGIQRKVEGLQDGATYPAIRDSDLFEQFIPLPSLPEQRAIAEALDAVQKAKEARQRELALERERKAALMEYLFSHGTQQQGRAVRQTRHGHVPADWQVMPLDQCAFIQTGVAKGRKLAGGDVISVPYLRVANVQDGYLDLAEMKSITIRRSELNRYRLQTGDVVLTEGGDFDKLGRGFIWHGTVSSCVHQNHIFAVRTNRELMLPEYLAYLAQSPYGKSYFLNVAHKTTNLACINKSKLSKFPALIPSLEEQSCIVNLIRASDAKIAALERETQLMNELFRAMLEELMTGRLSALPLIEEHQAQ